MKSTMQLNAPKHATHYAGTAYYHIDGEHVFKYDAFDGWVRHNDPIYEELIELPK